MAIDRATTLRNAEKLLRQGKVDAAITEYVRVVEENPRDWNTANVLGDLYVRAAKTDRAIEQFIRIADSLREQGFLPKAAALYKKVLKLKPDEEHALLQAGEIAAEQGFYADARAHLGAALDRRSARGDARGAAEVRVRLGSLDATDFDARIAAARARLEIDDTAGAVRDLDRIVVELIEKDRHSEAIEVLRQAAALAPGDAAIRARLLDLWLSNAESHFRSGRNDDGLAIAKQVLDEDASHRSHIARLASNLAAQAPEPAFLVIGLAVDAAVAERDWTAAAAALQEFIAGVPDHIPALMRLVEICVDGGLDTALDNAEGQLADAYLAAGQAAEARFIAEDLFTRHPSEPAIIERFRRLLELVGEPDPDAIIADRLDGLSPLADTDLNSGNFALPELSGDEREPSAAITAAPSEPAAPIVEPPPPAVAELVTEPNRQSDEPVRKSFTPVPRQSSRSKNGQANVFELSANAVDIESIVGEFDTGPRERPAAAPESVEVDLSVVLDDIKRPPRIAPLMPRNAPAAADPPPSLQGDDIEDVFVQLRDEASRRSAIEAAEQEFRRGLALKAAGDIDGCITALQSASKAPKLRFATASVLARIFRDRGLTSEAVHWYERAAQAPAPTADDYHLLLFELAEALEAEGEVIRALAVCLELQAEAGDYRDVAIRVDRLAKVQARG